MQATSWCRWVLYSARVSARLENSMPSEWMKSLYRSIRTIMVGCLWQRHLERRMWTWWQEDVVRGEWKSGWLDGKNEMEMGGLVA